MKDLSEWVGKSILVVDDSQELRSQSSELFEDLGLKVIGEASNGLEAIERFQEKKPDIVCLDIIMPEMNGIDCFRSLLKLDQNLRLFFVSCLSDQKCVIDGFKSQIPSWALLHKPINKDKLMLCLDKSFATEQMFVFEDHEEQSSA